MNKLDYLARTLSRAKRKDYENYVVNAIWNRLAMDDVKPVTQQLVLWPDGHRSFIDLFFPQAMIGVECDEVYHQNEVQSERDVERSIAITDVLRQVKSGEYQEIRIDVAQPYDSVEHAIDACVTIIRDRIQQRRGGGKFEPWTGKQVGFAEYFAERSEISVSDDIGFPRIVDAMNTLCGTHHKGYQRSYFIPPELREVYGDRYHVCFPKLSVNNKAMSRGWCNWLSDDGEMILESNEDAGLINEVGDGGDPNDVRITFARTRNPITRISEYRFVGVFRRIANSDDGTMKRHKRIATTFPLLRR